MHELQSLQEHVSHLKFTQLVILVHVAPPRNRKGRKSGSVPWGPACSGKPWNHGSVPSQAARMCTPVCASGTSHMHVCARVPTFAHTCLLIQQVFTEDLLRARHCWAPGERLVCLEGEQKHASQSPQLHHGQGPTCMVSGCPGRASPECSAAEQVTHAALSAGGPQTPCRSFPPRLNSRVHQTELLDMGPVS